MSFIDDLKKFAIARLKERRHRQAVMYLNSLPAGAEEGHRLDRPEYRRYE